MPAFSLVSKLTIAISLLATPLAMPAQAATLFAELGEQPGLTRIIDGLLPRVMADPRINGVFVEVDQERLHALLVLLLCKTTGGPCLYPGRDMKSSHADLNIKTSQFMALVEHLQNSMDANGVPFWTQNRVLALLAPMHRDIVAQ